MKDLPIVAFTLCLFQLLAAMVVYIVAAVAGMLCLLNANQVLEISTYAFGSALCGVAATALLAGIVATFAAWRERK